MSWVNAPEIRLWIREHALKTEGSSVTSNGLYSQGIVKSKVSLIIIVKLGAD